MMRKGSRRPRYICKCGRHWAWWNGRNKFSDCPSCGRAGPHRLYQLGWDGSILGFAMLAKMREGPEFPTYVDAQGREHAEY